MAQLKGSVIDFISLRSIQLSDVWKMLEEEEILPQATGRTTMLKTGQKSPREERNAMIKSQS